MEKYTSYQANSLFTIHHLPEILKLIDIEKERWHSKVDYSQINDIFPHTLAIITKFTALPVLTLLCWFDLGFSVLSVVLTIICIIFIVDGLNSGTYHAKITNTHFDISGKREEITRNYIKRLEGSDFYTQSVCDRLLSDAASWHWWHGYVWGKYKHTEYFPLTIYINGEFVKRTSFEHTLIGEEADLLYSFAEDAKVYLGSFSKCEELQILYDEIHKKAINKVNSDILNENLTDTNSTISYELDFPTRLAPRPTTN